MRVSRIEPDHESTFLASGGAIGAAAARGETDFAVTSSSHAVSMMISEKSSKITLELPEDQFNFDPIASEVHLRNRCLLNVTASRLGAGINGTIVSTMSGQASTPLSALIRKTRNDGHALIPLQYGNWSAHSAVVGVSNIALVDDKGDEFGVHVVDDKKLDAILVASEAVVKAVYDNSQLLRKKVVYEGSPRLSKVVLRAPCGINQSGFELVHNVVGKPIPFSLTTFDSIMEHAIGLELGYDEHAIDAFLQETASPSALASSHAETVASALSTAVNFLVPYRIDGRTEMTPKGSKMVATESWLGEPIRDVTDTADDCDGTGLLVTSLTTAADEVANDANWESSSDYKWVVSTSNALAHHFVGVSVLGANSGHADGANESAKVVAGHCAAIAMPKIQFLKALEAGAEAEIEASPFVLPECRKKLADARLDACYPEDVRSRLPEDEQALLSSWAVLKNDIGVHALSRLQPLAIEGTTPASSRLFTHEASERTRRARAADLDKASTAPLAPNIARQLKTLDTGANGGHKFYESFVELSLSSKDAMFMSPQLRGLGEAASQFILAPPQPGSVSKCGATPHDLSTENFIALPLFRLADKEAAILDVASAESTANILPARKGPTVLNDSQTKRLERSLSAFHNLAATLKPTNVGHPTQHLFAFASMLNNPSAVETFCAAAKKSAKGGVVDMKTVPGMAVDVSGAEVGNFVVVTVNL